MARIHARKKGKSGSTKPTDSKVDQWLEYDKDEVVGIVTDLAKQGLSQSEIGVVLRDQYGIPSTKVVVDKKVGQILKDKKLSKRLPEDFEVLLRRALKLRKHLEKNKQDFGNKRGMQLLESKIKRRLAYYKNKKILPKDMYYKAEDIELLLK